jgi:hypothetical protein
MVRASRVKAQRRATREALDAMASPPPTPRVLVTLTRISVQFADDDRAALSLAAVRDEVARWVCGVPFEEVATDKDGRPKLDQRGRAIMRAPRAPDGPGDELRWRYRQQKTKRRIPALKWGRPEVDKRGRVRMRGYTAAMIEIEAQQ